MKCRGTAKRFYKYLNVHLAFVMPRVKSECLLVEKLRVHCMKCRGTAKRFNEYLIFFIDLVMPRTKSECLLEKKLHTLLC